jgi:parallel beta-helix repeat protein
MHFKIIVIFLGVIALLVPAIGAIIIVNPGDSIQAAIYAARPGDTLQVNGGIYYEHLNVNKQLTLIGVNMPLLDATASGSCITLNADGVLLNGFRTINSGRWPSDGSEEAGIKVISSGCIILDNNASNNSNGIFIAGGNNNTIKENSADSNLGFGIKLIGCRDNSIFKNNFNRNYKSNAYDNGINRWDNGNIGNYYGDFNSVEQGCEDSDANGICDTIRGIPGGSSIDRYPSVHPLNFS